MSLISLKDIPIFEFLELQLFKVIPILQLSKIFLYLAHPH